MNVLHDGNGNRYISVGNLRVTWVVQPETHWAGEGDYLRIQAYRGDPKESNALHMPSELPIKSGGEAFDLISAIATLASEASAR